MRALLAFPLLALAAPLPAQEEEAPPQIALATGQLWVHRGGLRDQALGRDAQFHVTQLTCIGRALSGERFRFGGFIDLRPARLDPGEDAPALVLFTGVVDGRDGVSELAARTLTPPRRASPSPGSMARGEIGVPPALSPQAAFPPMPVADRGRDAEPDTRMATLWWGDAAHRGPVRIAEEGEVRLDELPCLLWHMNHQEQREAGPEGHRHGHTRISLWWDEAAGMPAQIQTYLLGAMPGRPFFQQTLTLRPRAVVTTSDAAAIAAFERLTDDPAPDAAVFSALAQHVTDPEARHLVQALAEALH